MYAAENIAHANATIYLGDFLHSTDINLDVQLENGETLEIEYITIDRAMAHNWFVSAIKSDAGIGEESIPKELVAYSLLAPVLQSAFGDV